MFEKYWQSSKSFMNKSHHDGEFIHQVPEIFFVLSYLKFQPTDPVLCGEFIDNL